jgi:hypothetical protein
MIASAAAWTTQRGSSECRMIETDSPSGLPIWSVQDAVGGRGVRGTVASRSLGPS